MQFSGFGMKCSGGTVDAGRSPAKLQGTVENGMMALRTCPGRIEMIIHSQEILNTANRTHADAVILAGRDHSIEDYKLLLKQLGSAVEIFLKKHVYVGTQNTSTFENLINGLEKLGVKDNDRQSLHNLRRAYNDAKHNPSYQAPIQPVIKVLADARNALVAISDLRLGDIDQPCAATIRRLLWFAAWDHYIGGDTEVSIFLPCSSDIDFPASFERIYLKMEDWNTVKAELSRAGVVCLGRDSVPAKFYDSWSREGDFLEAGSFEGDLRNMIRVFAAHERVEDILPQLKRENEPYSMLAAALFATTDLAHCGTLPDNVEEAAEAIIGVARDNYAAPDTSALLQQFASSIASMIYRCPMEMRSLLSGPLWTGEVRYTELRSESLLEADNLKLLIMNDGRLVTLI